MVKVVTKSGYEYDDDDYVSLAEAQKKEAFWHPIFIIVGLGTIFVLSFIG